MARDIVGIERNLDRIWLPATSFQVTLGSVTTDDINRWPGLSFPSTGTTIASIPIVIPEIWKSFRVYLYWSNLGANSGNVRWFIGHSREAAAGDTLNTETGTVLTRTAPSQNVLAIDAFQTQERPDGQGSLLFAIRRNAGDGADTLGNSALALGLLLEKL